MPPRDEYYQEFDEHNAPTEPLGGFHPPSNPADIAHETVPAPVPLERPFPALDYAPASSYPYARPPATPAYPVLPPKPVPQARAKPSAFPVFVGAFFVAVQLLLLVRFVLKFIGLQGNVTWVAIVYAVSNIFVLPFSLILQSIPLPIPASLELFTLIAILFYGLFSRILVRILKAVFR